MSEVLIIFGIIIAISIIITIIIYAFRGHKCPECGVRTVEVKSKKFIDTTRRKSDGTKDRRYNTRGNDLLTIKCSNEKCGDTFTIISLYASEKTRVDFSINPSSICSIGIIPLIACGVTFDAIFLIFNFVNFSLTESLFIVVFVKLFLIFPGLSNCVNPV